MNRIVVDSTGEILACAVASDVRTAELSWDTGLSHAERLMPSLDFLIREVGIKPDSLDYVACTSGPGSFTGLRIAISAMKGISAALSIPFILVPSLDAYAHPWQVFSGAVIPIVNAKKGRVYAAVYTGGIRTSDFLDVPFAELLAMLPRWDKILFTGLDADLAGLCEDSRISIDPSPRRSCALDVLALADEMFRNRQFSGNAAGPVYLRQSEADMGITLPKACNHGY